MDAVRSGIPLRAISRVIASCGRTMETAESMATWGGWFSLKYFAICAPWALAACDGMALCRRLIVTETLGPSFRQKSRIPILRGLSFIHGNL